MTDGFATTVDEDRWQLLWNGGAIRDEVPSATVIALQPVMGGPEHDSLCLRQDGASIRVSEQHPTIAAAIDGLLRGDVVAATSVTSSSGRFRVECKEIERNQRSGKRQGGPVGEK